MQRDKLKWWSDPKKIINYLSEKGEIVDAFYYIGRGTPPEEKQRKYLDILPSLGYTVYTKEIKTIYQDDGTTTQKANLDIEIVLDMFNTIDHYDMAVLLSGDGDFERPLSLLRARGKKFLVLSTQGFIASELRKVAGMHFIDFNDIKEKVIKDKGNI